MRLPIRFGRRTATIALLITSAALIVCLWLASRPGSEEHTVEIKPKLRTPDKFASSQANLVAMEKNKEAFVAACKGHDFAAANRTKLLFGNGDSYAAAVKEIPPGTDWDSLRVSLLSQWALSSPEHLYRTWPQLALDERRIAAGFLTVWADKGIALQVVDKIPPIDVGSAVRNIARRDTGWLFEIPMQSGTERGNEVFQQIIVALGEVGDAKSLAKLSDLEKDRKGYEVAWREAGLQLAAKTPIATELLNQLTELHAIDPTVRNQVISGYLDGALTRDPNVVLPYVQKITDVPFRDNVLYSAVLKLRTLDSSAAKAWANLIADKSLRDSLAILLR